MSDGQNAAPLFSVILPTYNRAPTLERAIRSVLGQTLRDFELLIIDDGSSDGTADLLRRYTGRDDIRVVVTARRGAGPARNLGARLTHGRYLAFQDSDDEWMPQKLERALSALRDTGPNTAMVYGDMVQVLPDGRRVDFKAPSVELGRLINDATNDFQVLNIGIQSAVIKKECFEAEGGFDEALPRLIDMELFLRLALKYRLVHLKEAVACYYRGPGISTNRAALVTARRYLLKKYNERLRASPRHLAWQYLYLAEALDKNGGKAKSVVWMLRAFCASPRAIGVKRLGFAVKGQWSKIG